MTLKFYTSVEKMLQLKVRKFLGLSPKGKTGRRIKLALSYGALKNNKRKNHLLISFKKSDYWSESALRYEFSLSWYYFLFYWRWTNVQGSFYLFLYTSIYLLFFPFYWKIILKSLIILLKVKQLITESRVDFISRKVDYNTEIKRNEAPDIIDQFSHHIETSPLLLCK